MTTITTEKTANSIELSGPIDYLIFTGALISIEWEGTDYYIAGNIIDRIDNIIYMRIDSVGNCVSFPVNEGIKGTITCSYSSLKLVFDVMLHNFDLNSLTCECQKPKYGYLINERFNHRARFNLTGGNTYAKIIAYTVNGQMELCTHTLYDFSQNTIAFAIPRSQGILLPRDHIDDIIIYKDNVEIFKSSGDVIRIEHRFDDDNVEIVFAVVSLIDPNNRPPIDIHKNERMSGRINMIDRNDAFIEFLHPFLNTKISSHVADLSNSGLSILVENDKYALLPGLYIPEASLQLPFRPRMSVPITIKGVNQSDKLGINLSRISIVFDNLSPQLAKEVNAFVQQSISDKLFDARTEDCAKLWEFYFEAGFIYESKRRQIQDYSASIRDTQQKLLDSESPLIKKILYKENGTIMGNGTAIKIFDNTLLLQHLNARKSHNGSAARAIIRGMTTFFLDSSTNRRVDNRYVCTYYRPDNTFPSLLFGGTTSLIDDTDISWTKDYQFCLPVSGYNFDKNKPPISSYREADMEDLSSLERLIIDSGEYGLFRLEGLSREKIINMRVFVDYKLLGLYRYRRVFVSTLDNTERCYAICNYSSPGMNLSELTNSVKFFFSTTDINKQRALLNTISPVIVNSYKATMMREPVYLLATNQPVPDGFKFEKVYTLWSMDLLYPKLFKEKTEAIFHNFKTFLRKKHVS